MNPTQSYIVCATPRSGSTLLCDLLADTGVAGRPDSFFRRESFAWWAQYFNVSATEWGAEHEFDQSYLAAARREGRGGTAVFGMRLMWESLDDLSKRLDFFYPDQPSDRARFEAAFGQSVYVHLFREDKVAQAVSHLRAEQTGLWHVNADGTERERLKPGDPSAYDARGISEYVEESEKHDTAWKDWFVRQEIRPVCVKYEALSSEPQAVLATVLDALGQDPAIANAIDPKTAKLADTESREWITRFRSK